MTIFCDWPRSIYCNVCPGAPKRLVLSKSAETTAAHDAAMRNAGWVEYAPRFVVRLFGGSRHARPLHVCPTCLVGLEGKDGLRERSIDLTNDPEKRVHRSGRRLDVALGLAKSVKGQKLGSRRTA